MATHFQVSVDWDLDGAFDGTYDNITAYVEQVSSAVGCFQYMTQRIADPGWCTIAVDNASRFFSPANSSSPVYGKLLPGRPVVVRAIEGANFWTIFRGTIKHIKPDADVNGARKAILTCSDRMADLSDFNLSLPMQLVTSGGPLIRKITAETYRLGAASGIVYVAANAAAGDTVTIGDRLYAFTTGTPAANYVKIGTYRYQTADNLAAAINADTGAGTTYGTGTDRHEDAAAVSRYEVHAANGYTAQLPIGNVSGNQIWQAQSFTPGVTAYPTLVSFYLGDVFGTPTMTMDWEIRNNSGGLPGGTIITSGTVTPTANTNMIVTVAGPTAALNNGTVYWLVLHASADQPLNTGYYVRSHNPGVYGGGGHAQSSNNGSSWTAFAYDLSFSVRLGGVVDLTALSRGAWGNAIGLAESSAGLVVSGANLTGGADLGAGDLVTDAGQVVILTAADQWDPQLTTAWDAARDVTHSEFGFFWAQQDGTFQWHNRNYQFTQVAATPAMTLDNTFHGLSADISIDRVVNRAEVSYIPRSTLTAGVVARANNTIEVPVTSYDPRWTTTIDLPVDGNFTLRLPYVDAETGRRAGAVDLINPVAGTDYNVYESIGGRDYTTTGSISVSVAPTGSGVEVTFVNHGGTSFFVTDFQVRGTLITAYDPQQVTLDHTTSQDAYGRRTGGWDLPLPIDRGAVLARSLAEYLLARFATPAFLASSITFQAPVDVIGGVNVFSLVLGDTLLITEDQTGISGDRYMLIGVSYDLAPADAGEGDEFTATFELFPLGDVTYGILDHATYGKLDSTARLAL